MLACWQAAFYSSWSVLAHVIRLNAKVLGMKSTGKYSSMSSSQTPPRRGVRFAKGFQNVAAPLHMSEASVGGYDIEERLPLP